MSDLNLQDSAVLDRLAAACAWASARELKEAFPKGVRLYRGPEGWGCEVSLRKRTQEILDAVSATDDPMKQARACVDPEGLGVFAALSASSQEAYTAMVSGMLPRWKGGDN